MMPGKGVRSETKPKVRHIKAKHQKKRFMRSKDPILAVFMWGVQHSINELNTSIEPSLLLPEDFKAFSKVRVENQYYNKENLPGHFKFKEYCPRVFHDLRKRFGMDDVEYMNSIINHPPQPSSNPGRSGAKFFNSYDQRVVVKSISSEEVALLHQILQPYHVHVVTTEGKTLLPQYLGMYRLTVNNAESYWIAMRNVVSSTVKVHWKFDLKGSTVDRAASTKEKAKTSPTFKDNDFMESGKKIVIGEVQKEPFMRMLEKDVTLLQRMNLMDYSLLVGIHDCTLPPDPEEDEENLDEGNGYLSSDDNIIEEAPQSPKSPISPAAGMSGMSGDELMSSGEALGPPTISEPLPSQLQQSSPPGEELAEATRRTPDVEETGSPTPLVFVMQESAPLEPSGATAYTYQPAVVEGEKAVEAALSEGLYPVIDKTVDVFAIPGVTGARPQVYFMGIIDVLTNYGARKRAAHAAKTVKHGAGAEFSTVNPEQYARRFLEFMLKNIE